MTLDRVLVQKFGGTSMATPDARQQVVGHVRRARDEGYRVVIVVSAMGRRGDPYATDTLLDLLRADGGPVDPRDYTMIFVTGEIIAAAVMSHTLKRAGIPAVALTGVQAGIYTDGQPVEADIIDIDSARLRVPLSQGKVPVVTGGQGACPVTLDYATMGRGASDTSAVALGVALEAEKVDVFTDVDGVAVADPRVVPQAKWLDRIRFDDMHEMARFGAKVLHPRAVLTGGRGRTPIVVRSTFSMAPGTTVGAAENEAPIVGLPILAPLETVVVPGGVVDTPNRESWERRHVIMSLVDDTTGDLVLGISAERAADLSETLAQHGIAPIVRVAEQGWLSIVGDDAALASRRARDIELLGRTGITVRWQEHTARRSTYVMPTERVDGAAWALYADIFE